MNYLKNAVGLLNAQAPEGEFLAYINPDEAKMLKDAGGSGLLTPQGIPSYRSAEAQSNRTGGASRTGSSSSSSSGNSGGGRTDSQSQYGGGSSYDSSQNTSDRGTGFTVGANSPTVPDNNESESLSAEELYQDRIQRIASGVEPTSQPFDQRSDLAKTGDAILDFISGGGIIGNTFKALGDFADNFNKKRRNDFMSTADIKEYELGTGKNWNPNNVTNKNSDEYKYLKNETDYFQQFNNDDNRNEDDPSSFFDNPQDMASQNLANNPNPFSQVDNYFNNMASNNLGISNNFMTSYNQAKADLAQSLNMTSNASQFGYNANMSASNIYYNYLKEQGLL